MPDFRAKPIHPRSDPPNAGTKQERSIGYSEAWATVAHIRKLIPHPKNVLPYMIVLRVKLQRMLKHSASSRTIFQRALQIDGMQIGLRAQPEKS
jgi:hypothetical protein